MNKSKINDFINVWAEVVGLTGEANKKYRNFIKTDIVRRCELYEKEIQSISVKDDNCSAYIIKPINGEYSFEDFLLNRLMLGLRDVSFIGSLEGNGGEYIAENKSLEVSADTIDFFARDKAKRHTGLQGKSVQIVQKTIEHELGHCYKSKFSDGFKAPLGNGREQDELYKKLINALAKFENGKYASQINSITDFELEEESIVIKTGVRDSEVTYSYDSRFCLIDELLNETEALELSRSNEIHDTCFLQNESGRNSSSGNYVNVYNYLSGYRSFTGYGQILKSLLGKENTFKAEYISSIDIFLQFDQDYADIVKDVWGLDPQKYSPMKCIFMDFDSLLNNKQFNENIMLKLDEFFAKCYERKVEKTIAQSNGSLSPKIKKSILSEIEVFQSRLTTNVDSNKRDALMHNVIFNNIKERINELSIQTNQPNVSYNAYQLEEDYQIEKKESPKMRYLKGFIRAYEDTETEYQYNQRANNEFMYMQKLLDIIETNGTNKRLISDLEAKLSRTSIDGEFKEKYSQKQVNTMARLLKVAQLLTENKNFNPKGRNYLEEFTSIPDIEYILKQMKNDFRNTDSYMYELKQRASDNRRNGNIPSYPPTPAEISASNNPAQEIQQEDTKALKCISIEDVKECVSRSKVTTQETRNTTQRMKNFMDIQRLQVMQRTGGQLTPEQMAQLNEHIIQTQQAQMQFRQKGHNIKRNR